MEGLATALWIGLFLLACVGVHFFMMRGGHGDHGDSSSHDPHGDQPAAGVPDAARLRQLESEVAALRQQIAASRKVSNGSRPAEPGLGAVGKRGKP